MHQATSWADRIVRDVLRVDCYHRRMSINVGKNTSTETRAVGLYLHIPFCDTKCGYCDFFSVAMKDREPGPLVGSVIAELAFRLADPPREVRTIFCGGGTPTVLPTSQLRRLLEAVVDRVPRSGVQEFTVEANPATVDDEKAKLLVEHGVTRVSMGAQSFLPAELAALERLHSPDDIPPSVATLRRHGVEQVNLDLIFGVPGQTLETWKESLRRAIDLDPDHIACYGLTYEPGTRLTAQRKVGRVTPCEENLEADMYLCAIDTLSAAGFEQYEISNFAKPGCECLHNLIYWRNQPFIAVGPSAAGFVDGRRYKNISEVNGYIRLIKSQGHAEAESELVTGRMLASEMMLMQLRLVEGLDLDDFRERTGAGDQPAFEDAVNRLADLGLVSPSPTRVALTRGGRLVADAVITELATACDADAELELASQN